MKRCPTCHQTYTDETIKFCRVDGALLIEDASPTDDASATRILPGSQTDEAAGLLTDTAQSQGTTSALEAGKIAKARTGEFKAGRPTSSVEYIVTAIKQHKLAAAIAVI